MSGGWISMDYNKQEFHGGKPVSSKCHYSWEHNMLCFHQTCEVYMQGMDVKDILRRDFTLSEDDIMAVIEPKK